MNFRYAYTRSIIGSIASDYKSFGIDQSDYVQWSDNIYVNDENSMDFWSIKRADFSVAVQTDLLLKDRLDHLNYLYSTTDHINAYESTTPLLRDGDAILYIAGYPVDTSFGIHKNNPIRLDAVA